MRVSPLLTLNPELQRLLWLEFSPTRLIAMPLVMAALVFGVIEIGGREMAANLAQFAVKGLLLLWGTRRAAESFAEELRAGTWDLQCLSTATPITLALGKCLGGASYVWYGAACVAVALVVLEPATAPWFLLGTVLAGIAAQLAALLAEMTFHRFQPNSRTGNATAAQILGLALGAQLMTLLVLSPSGANSDVKQVIWYGIAFPAPAIILSQEVALILWLFVGIVRTMRRELGHEDGPLAWTLFTLYVALVASGFGTNAGLPILAELGTNGTMIGIATAVALLLTYIGALCTPAATVTLKRLAAAIRARDWPLLWQNLPIWVPSAVLATLLAIAALPLQQADESATLDPAITIAAIGFMLRDVALVYLVRLTWRRRTLVALVVLFGILYGLLPTIFGSSLFGLARLLFVPIPPDWHGGGGETIGIAAIIPWCEAAFVLFLVWQKLTRIILPKPV
jgi:hypothetical protein